MHGIPSVSDWGKYVKLGLMMLQGKEVICHSVGEQCKRTQISAMAILEATVGLLSQHISSSYEKEYQDEVLIFTELKDKQFSPKEAAQLIWHGFRLSSGYPPLQFTMMYQAWKKYGKQNISVDECWDIFSKQLKVGKTHSTTTIREWEEPNWRPPHPKVNRFVNTIEHGTDIGLSNVKSHAIITSQMIADGIEAIKMLLEGKGGITSKDDYNEKTYTTRSKKLELKGECINSFLELDYSYIIGKTGDSSRPNRNPEYDGKNNIKDRFFSYLVWFIIRNNKTGNDFFDEYFSQLHDFFPKWFAGLPTDKELKDENILQKSEKDWYIDKKPLRKRKNGYFNQTTKEDVLILIARYNATHPDTQVSMNELYLKNTPQIFIK